MQTKIIIKHSNDGMDSWYEGRELSFTVTSSKPLNPDKIGDLAKAYLHATNTKFYEFMFKTEIISND